MFCPSCGIENDGSSNFCADCGTVLPKSKGHVAATIAPPPNSPVPRSPILGPPGTQAPAGGLGGGVSTVPPDSGVSIHAALTTGAVFAGRYEILGQLGKGGMGVVYRAKDIQLGGQELAIKVLQSQFTSDPDLVERFKREIITARRITHANVIRIHDFGVSGDEAFISMELLTGGTLSDVVAGKELPLPQGIDIARQVAAGLAAAHDEGIIHRDIKPHNVMFDDKGKVKLLDFGIARLSHVTSHTVGFTGTPHYMSPEQAEGKEVTYRSDIYSLGVLMFEIFTGKLPFQADSLVRLAVMHAQEPPPPLRAIRSDLPEELETIVLHALEKDSGVRYQDAGHIAADLEAFNAGRPLQFAQPGATPRPSIPPVTGDRSTPQTFAPRTPGPPSEPKEGGGGAKWVAIALAPLVLAGVLFGLWRLVIVPGQTVTPTPTRVAVTKTPAVTATATATPTRKPVRTKTPVKTRVATPKPTRTKVAAGTVRPTSTAGPTVKPTTVVKDPGLAGKTRFIFRLLDQDKKPIPNAKLYFCGRSFPVKNGLLKKAFRIDEHALNKGCEVQVFVGGQRRDRGEYKIYPGHGDLIKERLIVDL